MLKDFFRKEKKGENKNVKKGIIKILFLGVAIFAIFIFFAPTAKMAVINATSCSYADVSTAIVAASAGDTIMVPAGTATWNNSLVITKGIILKGAGIDKTIIIGDITDQDGGMVVYHPANPSVNEPFRFTGFTLNANFKSNGIRINNYTATKISNFRIDHNRIINSGGNNAGRCILIAGTVYGVIDNNVIEPGGRKALDVYGIGETSWKNFTFNFGTSDNLYYEDNIFNIIDTPSSGGDGGRYCARFNTYNSTASLWPWFDAHGNMGTGGNYSTMGVEIYGNVITVDNPGHSEDVQIDVRGGKALVFNNITNANNGNGYIRVREEIDDALNPPAISPINGQPQHVSDSYFWENRKNGASIFNAVLSVTDNYGNALAEDREFYNQVNSFNGTTGIGVGLLANRPATCALGVGYWATDQGEWNANHSGPDGQLYKCTSVNTWELYYIPYVYPHPLRITGLLADDTVAPSVPANLSGTAVSATQINLVWNASTDNVGVVGYQIFRDNNRIATSISTNYSNINLSPSTKYTYYIRAYDIAGNLSSSSVSVSASTLSSPSDIIPPVGSVSINSGDIYTNSVSSILSLIASDISGVFQMKLSDRNDNFASIAAIPFTPTYEWILAGVDGVKTVYAWFSDNIGNWMTTPVFDTIILDTSYPVISSILISDITDNSAVITWETSEPTIGYVHYGFSSQYSLSTVEETSYSTSHSVNLSSLSDSTAYYFQIIASDRADNQSFSVNNIFSTASSSVPDAISPSAISDLRTVNIYQTGVDLSWAAPGDDGNSGIAGSYDLRYSTSPINNSSSVGNIDNWYNNANTVSDEPSPSISGTTENLSIVGLSPNTTYYFIIKTRDEVGNISSVSNIISFTTIQSSSGNGDSSGDGDSSGGGGGGTSDTTPPNAPTNLTATGIKNQVYLTWNNPTNGDFAGIKLYRKENSYPSDRNDSQAKLIYQGKKEYFNDIGLENEKTYYYSIYAYNYQSNYSISANAFTRTDSSKETIEKTDQKLTNLSVENSKKEKITSLVGVKSSEVEKITNEEAKEMLVELKRVQLSELTLKIYEKIIKLAPSNFVQEKKYAVADFIHNGTPTTGIIGAGERGGSIASFHSAFGRMPESETDWQDVIKIANGRWPTQRNISAEQRAKDIFRIIYLRIPDLNNQNDDAAITVITYGLRPAQRNLNNEKVAINSFKHIYKKNPFSAQDWDIVRAIAYSGAKRQN